MAEGALPPAGETCASCRFSATLYVPQTGPLRCQRYPTTSYKTESDWCGEYSPAASEQVQS